MDTFRKERSQKIGSAWVSDQARDASPDMDRVRVIGDISVSQEPDYPSTPATSHHVASTLKARSTYTEELRPSMSSRTDESMLNLQERYQPLRNSDDFRHVAKEQVPRPRVVKKTEIIRGSGATETRSWRRYGLGLWSKLRLLRKKGSRFILKRAEVF